MSVVKTIGPTIIENAGYRRPLESIETLPDEILLRILQIIGSLGVIALRVTSTRLYKLSFDKHVWREFCQKCGVKKEKGIPWRDIYHQHFSTIHQIRRQTPKNTYYTHEIDAITLRMNSNSYVVGFADYSFVIYNAKNGVEKEFLGHKDKPTDALITTNTLFTASRDGTVILWNRNEDLSPLSLSVIAKATRAKLCLQTNGHDLYVTANHFLNIVDCTVGNYTAKIPTKIGSIKAFTCHEHLAVMSGQKEIQIWDLKSHQPTHHLQAQQSLVTHHQLGMTVVGQTSKNQFTIWDLRYPSRKRYNTIGSKGTEVHQAVLTAEFLISAISTPKDNFLISIDHLYSDFCNQLAPPNHSGGWARPSVIGFNGNRIVVGRLNKTIEVLEFKA